MKKSRLGDYIELVDIRNSDNSFGVDKLRGISISKILTPTKADTAGLNLKGYKIVRHNWFTYCTVTSRNGNKISIAYNDGDDCIVSAINPVFKIKDGAELLPRYLMMFFNRREFDRYARFNSWGSARETFSWEDFCDTQIELPSKSIQEKYVAIYEGLLMNLCSYESGLSDLKLICDAYIEKLRKESSVVELGPFIQELCEKNNGRYSVFQGVNVDMEFTEPKRVADDVDSGKVVHYNEFAFNKVMKANCTKLPIALRKGETCVVSGSYTVFKVLNEEELLPDYLMLWLAREETQRWAGFVSYGTTRDIFDFDTLSTFKLPIPEITIQKSICEILSVISKRKNAQRQLSALSFSICPILIRGSIMEAKGGN